MFPDWLDTLIFTPHAVAISGGPWDGTPYAAVAGTVAFGFVFAWALWVTTELARRKVS